MSPGISIVYIGNKKLKNNPSLDTSGNTAARAKALQDRAGQYEVKNQPAQAVKYYNEALQLYKYCEAEVLSLLGPQYEGEDNVLAANECYLAALTISQELNQYSLASTMAFSAAVLYHYQLDDDKSALDYYQRALALLQHDYEPTAEILYSLNIGTLHQSAGRLPEAKYYYERCIELDAGNGQGEAEEALVALEELG